MRINGKRHLQQIDAEVHRLWKQHHAPQKQGPRNTGVQQARAERLAAIEATSLTHEQIADQQPTVIYDGSRSEWLRGPWLLAKRDTTSHAVHPCS